MTEKRTYFLIFLFMQYCMCLLWLNLFSGSTIFIEKCKNEKIREACKYFSMSLLRAYCSWGEGQNGSTSNRKCLMKLLVRILNIVVLT